MKNDHFPLRSGQAAAERFIQRKQAGCIRIQVICQLLLTAGEKTDQAVCKIGGHAGGALRVQPQMRVCFFSFLRFTEFHNIRFGQKGKACRCVNHRQIRAGRSDDGQEGFHARTVDQQRVCTGKNGHI